MPVTLNSIQEITYCTSWARSMDYGLITRLFASITGWLVGGIDMFFRPCIMSSRSTAFPILLIVLSHWVVQIASANLESPFTRVSLEWKDKWFFFGYVLSTADQRYSTDFKHFRALCALLPSCVQFYRTKQRRVISWSRHPGESTYTWLVIVPTIWGVVLLEGEDTEKISHPFMLAMEWRTWLGC